MRKILMGIMVLTMFASAQIFRHSESGTKQPKIEYTQGGILLRFDFKQVERIDMNNKSLMWEYQEFWIPLNMAIADIQKVIGTKGYKLTDNDIKLLTFREAQAIEMLVLSGADSTEIAEIIESGDLSLLWTVPAGLTLLTTLEGVRRWRAKRKAKRKVAKSG